MIIIKHGKKTPKNKLVNKHQSYTYIINTNIYQKGILYLDPTAGYATSHATKVLIFTNTNRAPDGGILG